MNPISSNHLKLIKILRFMENLDYEFLENFFKEWNTRLYIKDIYSIICPNKKNKLNIMVEELLNYDNLFLKLKKFQILLKEERKFFIILELLINKSLNLEECAEELSVTRRTLNYDIIDIKKNLLEFNLKLNSQIGKGIFLDGNDIDIKRASFYYFYKFLIESKFLPKVFFDRFDSFFYNNKSLDLNINELIKQCEVDIFFNTKELIKSFYLSFGGISSNNSFETLQLYFSEIFQGEELDIFVKTLKKTVLKNIDHQGILFFVELLKVLTGKISEKIFSKKYNLLIWNNFFLENFNIIPDYENIEILNALILRINFIDRYFPIYSSDTSFLDLNFEKSSFDKVITLFQWLKKYYKNISFSDVIFLFLLMKNFKIQEKEITVIYRDIPKYVLINLKEKIEIQYNIKIVNIIHINNLEISKYRIKSVGIFCNIDLSSYDFEVLKFQI